MKQMIGCNYWDSENGTDMWLHFDPQVIDKDFESLANYGVEYLRVFPSYREFQPVTKLYAWRLKHGEYVFGNNYQSLDDNPLGIDPVQIENFRTMCRLAEKHGIKLIVAIVTGWMSGMQLVPPVVAGRNPINDPEAIMWQQKFIKGFVDGVKDMESIVMWELGNECNCLGQAASRAEAYMWTSLVTSAIRAADPTRPVSSGMHGLDADEDGIWVIKDQGEITDMLTTHPYPSPTIGGDIEPYNNYRTTILPTAQTDFYADLSGKPAMIEEQGSFSLTIGNRDMDAMFLRVNMLSGLANNSMGYFWWCAQEHTHLNNPPYTWSMMERELGLVYRDRSPKPVACMMKKMQEVITALPFDSLPRKKTEAVCVLSRETERWQVGSMAYVLAKQAGFNFTFANVETTLPVADIYMLPCITGWAVSYKRTTDFIFDRVFNHGATLYISFNTGHLAEFETLIGARSLGFLNTTGEKTARFGFGDITYKGTKEILLDPTDCRVLAANEDGNPVLTVNAFGKGKIYFLGFPLEQMLWGKVQCFDSRVSQPYYKIYREFAADAVASYAAQSADPDIGVTQFDLDDGRTVIFAVNYSERAVNPMLEIADGYKMTSVYYGNPELIDGCDATIIELGKIL